MFAFSEKRLRLWHLSRCNLLIFGVGLVFDFEGKMVRPYGIKVNKRKERRERYDKEEDEEEEQPKFEKKQKERVKRAKKEVTAKAEEEDDEENEIAEEAADELDVGIPIVVSDNKKDQTGVIFVLEKASLEVAKVGKVI